MKGHHHVFYSFLTFAFLALVFVFSGSTVTAASNTYIAGKVTTQGNDPVSDASIVAVCHHSDGDHATPSPDITTQADGTYTVTFPDTQCSPADIVTVTATKGTKSGTNSGIVNHFGLGGGITLDIAIVNVVVPVPEFGLITSAVAMIASTGYYFGFKKRSV